MFVRRRTRHRPERGAQWCLPHRGGNKRWHVYCYRHEGNPGPQQPGTAQGGRQGEHRAFYGDERPSGWSYRTGTRGRDCQMYRNERR